MKGIENNRKAMYTTTLMASRYCELVRLGKEKLVMFNKLEKLHEGCIGYNKRRFNKAMNDIAIIIDTYGTVALQVFGVAYEDYHADIEEVTE